MSRIIEKRALSLAAAELRIDDSGERPKIVGYAAKFNVETVVRGYWYDFREKLLPGCFSKVLRERQDIRALVNHNPDIILGRTIADTLELVEDDIGLKYAIDPPDSPIGQSYVVSVRRRDMTGASMAMIVGKQQWSELRSDNPLREIIEVDQMYDICLATYPQYIETTADVRTAEGAVEPRREQDAASRGPRPRLDQARRQLRLADAELN